LGSQSVVVDVRISAAIIHIKRDGPPLRALGNSGDRRTMCRRSHFVGHML
jgi:hypothetical protein